MPRARLFPGLPLMLVLLVSGCDRGGQAAVSDAPVCRVAQPPVMLPDRIPESSGVAVSRTHESVIWTHNDSGSEPTLYAVNSAGRLLGQVLVRGAEQVDWEDIAIADCDPADCIYIADIGDNQARRSEVTIYRVPEPHPTDSETLAVEAFPMRYPSGPRDAEALFVLPSGELFVVTKGENAPIELFRYPGPLRADETAELERLATLSTRPAPLPDRVTGASASIGGEWTAIRTYTSILIFRTADLLGSETTPSFNVDLSSVGEVQGEAVGFAVDGSMVVTSEGVGEGLPGTIAVVWCPL
ncbi:MAG: hypothetical protein WD737_04155 [Gemmatimonadota bacterium]